MIEKTFIHDEAGHAIAVILPIEQYNLVKDLLEKDEETKLQEMEEAAYNTRFMSDLQETMLSFAAVDAEWWEKS
jgi:hypothetical protein